MTAATVAAGRPTERQAFTLPGPLWIWALASVVFSAALARVVSNNNDLTSPSMFGLAIRTAAPIAMAGLAGLYAERSGTVNIGLEGMMILGTVFAGWWGWEYGPWMAVVGGAVGGALGGILLGIATTTFKVNHIVAGFAINIIAPGVARFMSTVLFEGEQGGGLTNSPSLSGDMGAFTMPFVSGGPFFGLETWDPLGRISAWHWFAVSDVAGFLKGASTGIRLDILLGIGLFVFSGFLLWRTPFGLRLRSAGERPSAADSLGVNVLLYRYIGITISGALAGLGGAMLVIYTGRYNQGMVAGRGFLGLATLVVGNWRPAGVGIGAAIFGFFDGVTLRLNPEELVIALLLAAAILLTIALAYTLATKPALAPKLLILIGAAGGTLVVLEAFADVLDENTGLFLLTLAAGLAVTGAAMAFAGRFDATAMAIMAMATLGGFFVYLRVDVPGEFVGMTPYLVTLIVVASRGQALRPPAQAGEPYTKGQQG